MLRGPVLCVATTAVLAGCSVGAGIGHRSVKDCSDRVGFNQRAAAARAAGVTGNIYATPEEQAAIDACVTGGRGTAVAPVRTSPPAPTAAQPIRTAAQPVPAAPAHRQQAVRGSLPLPTQYPLLPGDAELWPTLALAEQQRAMLYLKDGSTIRSSLGAN